jgi:DNA polymerase-3 subunit epsilon
VELITAGATVAFTVTGAAGAALPNSPSMFLYIICVEKIDQRFLESERIMKLLFIDTETNGLPANRYAAYTATSIWPHVIQISWQLIETSDWSVINEQDAFLTPRAEWNKDAERVHQIPESLAKKFGKAPADVFQTLHRDILASDGIVAHNMPFDKSAILCEIQRLWESGNNLTPEQFWSRNKKTICTMALTKTYCNIKFADGNGYKFPKLAELYTKLFGTEYDISGATLHNSKYDVSCLIMCFRRLIEIPEFASLLNI